MSLQSELVQWFRQNQRPLPWRRHYRPYEVWISEMMLQQTQMRTVLPYYRKWMKRFPSIRSLARASEREVLKAWEGLGYYSRARNLHASARLIIQKFAGEFPRRYEDILSLKGVGRYSAGAISSIAFNERRPIVDGNVLRVLSRLYAIRKPIDIAANVKSFWNLEERLIPEDTPREFNQGLMELGALVCTGDPECPLCPIASYCRAYKNGNPGDFPVRAKKKKLFKVTALSFVVRSGNRYLIRYRPLGEIFGGLWEFPEWKIARHEHLSSKKVQCLLQRKMLARPAYLGNLRRHYTQYTEIMHVFEIDKKEKIIPQLLPGGKEVWVTKSEFADYPFSSAHKRIIEQFI